MKNYIYIIAIFFGLAACEFEDERLDFLSDPDNLATTYYMFDDAAGDSVIVVEGSTGVIRIETPLKLPGTAIVKLTISGPDADAIGVDVTLDNSTTFQGNPINEIEISGNQITATIQNKDTIASLPMNIGVTIDDNNLTQESRYITLSLDTAYILETSTPLEVGDNNGEFGEVVVVLSDDDCESTLGGTWTSINCYPDPQNTVTWTEDATINGIYSVSDITGGYFAYAGAPAIPATIVEKCGVLSGEDFDLYGGALQMRNISGSVNADGTITLEWDEVAFAGVSCSTVFTPM